MIQENSINTQVSTNLRYIFTASFYLKGLCRGHPENYWTNIYLEETCVKKSAPLLLKMSSALQNIQGVL